MRRAGIIGWPLRHTLSPVMQQAAFDQCGIKAEFVKLPTRSSDLAEVVAQVRGDGWLGACVTIPHKEQVLHMVDQTSRTASSVGAVNFIVNDAGRLIGHNTDSEGFLRGLWEQVGVTPSGMKVLMVGAGGAARAITFALKQALAAELTIANRTMDKAKEISRLFGTRNFITKAIGISQDELREEAQKADLIVNASSIGMANGPAPHESPIPPDAVPSSAICYDIVYTPVETPFLNQCEAAGAKSANGLPMLVHQGALGFELLTGTPSPIDVMNAAVIEALL